MIAVDAARPVGAIWIRRFESETPGYGFVDDDTPELSMAVIPGCRGRGIGTEMLRRMLQIIDDRGVGVSLSVSKENPARRLYERHGFEVIESFEDSLTMIRRGQRGGCNG